MEHLQTFIAKDFLYTELVFQIYRGLIKKEIISFHVSCVQILHPPHNETLWSKKQVYRGQLWKGKPKQNKF